MMSLFEFHHGGKIDATTSDKRASMHRARKRILTMMAAL